MIRETYVVETEGTGPTFQHSIKRNRRWYIAQGVLFIIVGILALIVPSAAVIGLEVVLAALLLVSGAYQVYQGATDRSGWLALSGLLSLLIGLALVIMPIAGAVALATLIAVFLLVEGAIEIVFSFQVRFSPRWKWLLFSGILSLILGVLLLIGWPEQTLVLAGVLLAINFLFYGASILAVAYDNRAKS